MHPKELLNANFLEAQTVKVEFQVSDKKQGRAATPAAALFKHNKKSENAAAKIFVAGCTTRTKEVRPFL